MEPLTFRDDLFDNPTGDWIQSYSDMHFRQRYLHQDGAIYCETLMTVHAPAAVDSAIELISGPWDWWEHGRITGFTRNPDGSSDQVLSPVWWFITRVGLHLYPPAALEELRGTRIPLLLTQHFTGPASMDVYPDPSGGAAFNIRGRFHGVEYHMPAIPNSIAEALHLGAEAGTMPLPFPKGTGWAGLLEKLEAQSRSGSAIMAH
jgi:hypothetical protein